MLRPKGKNRLKRPGLRHFAHMNQHEAAARRIVAATRATPIYQPFAPGFPLL
jgi:hypothetical protein